MLVYIPVCASNTFLLLGVCLMQACTTYMHVFFLQMEKEEVQIKKCAEERKKERNV
jgi:hypothetical protein